MVTSTKKTTETKEVKPALDPKQDWALDCIAENFGLLVEFGTGTGKNRIIATSIKELIAGGEAPILVFMPNSLLDQFIEQCEYWIGPRWTERNIEYLHGKIKIERRWQIIKRSTKPVILISHESMSNKWIRDALYTRKWAAAYGDEMSRFRNASNRTTTLRGVGTRSASRYAFTGQLTVRSPADCWYVTNWLRPGCWGTMRRDTFLTKYFILGGFTGSEPMGLRPDREAEFFAVLDSLRIQCQLSEMRTLPKRTLSIRHTNMGSDQERVYHQMRTQLRMEIERIDDTKFLSEVRTYATRLLRLQEICAGFGRNINGEVVYLHNPKTDELVQSLLDDPNTPTIIWYYFRPEYEVIRRALMKAGLDHVKFGEPHARRRFNSGEVNLFVSQVSKGGYGLNLTRADKMEFHTLPWDLDVYGQAQERNNRLDKGDPKKGYLEIWHNVLTGTCEEYVRGRLVGKADMARKFSRSQALEMLK